MTPDASSSTALETAQPVFIDTHTHLNDHVYESTGFNPIERALAVGVKLMILPGTSLDELPSMKLLAASRPDVLRMFIGLHPTELTDNPHEALAIIEREIDAAGKMCVGVGEIGIDLHESPDNLHQQMHAFEAQCLMALARNLPINIHCRDALDQTLEVLSGLPEVPRGAFHCFGGTPADVERIRRVGDFYFGINGVVTFKNSGLRQTLPCIGIDRIILETDAPYLAPVPYRGKLNDSSHIPLIATTVADTLGLTLEDVARITTDNACNVYSLPKPR